MWGETLYHTCFGDRRYSSPPRVRKAKRMLKKPSYEELHQKCKDLEEGLEIYRSLVNNSPDLFYRASLDGRISYISPSVYRLSGYTVEEAIGMNLSEEIYLFPDERKIFLEELTRNGQVDNFEAQLKRKDGSVWWASSNAHFVEDKEGNILGVEGIVRDITRLKTATQALQESEERFRLTFQTSPDAINLNRVADGMYIDINDGFTELTGYLREDIVGKSSLDINIWKDPDDRKRLIDGLMKSGAVNDLEAQFVRKNGEIGIGLMSARIIKLLDEAVVLSLTKDITERKRTEEALRLAQFVFDRASIGIFRSGSDARILNANPQACKSLGYTHDELCKMTLFEIDPSISSEDWDDLWRRTCKDEILTFETVHRCKDGTTFPVGITANLLEFGGNKYSITFVRDISEQKESEKQWAQMEAHIREAQRMEALGTLAGGIAHDFNNVLGAISGYAELAQCECLGNVNLRRYIDQICSASVRAKKLIQQILAFSRQASTEKAPIDISRVVKEALTLIAASFPSTIEIVQNIPPNLGAVSADETQIHQIVMNLCANAHHEMKTTGGRLEISLSSITLGRHDTTSYPDMSPGKYLKISVADTGSGIAPDQIKRIFDPYFTTKPIGEGTGMGLSTVHGIVRDHGGSIIVCSDVGEGTTFHVYLPFAGAETDVAVGQAEQLPTGRERILFVDDENVLIDLGKALLERLGYRVETRTSAIDALEAFRADPRKYDLIISDMTMPRMTGDELAQRIRVIRPDIPIILCSGFSERINAKAMAAIGVSAVLMKPMAYADLANTVRGVLENQRMET